MDINYNRHPISGIKTKPRDGMGHSSSLNFLKCNPSTISRSYITQGVTKKDFLLGLPENI